VSDSPVLRDESVTLLGGPRLALRRAEGPRRPFLLVHGLASNARLWDGVAIRLAAAGHEVVAVDLRGHGRSEQVTDGHDTATAADDLSAVCAAVGLVGERAPVAAGQSWGGHVVLTLAARHGGVAAAALVDGGWLSLKNGFTSFEECWEALAPPRFDGVRMADLLDRAADWHRDWPEEGRMGSLANFVELPDGTVQARLSRENHRSILRSLWEDDPAELYPRVDVPVLLAAAVPADLDPFDARPQVVAALRALPHAEVRWYVGADHDLHAQRPDQLTDDLLVLAAAADAKE